MKNSGVFSKTVENIGLKKEKTGRFVNWALGGSNRFKNMGQWVWLRQIRSELSDESGGPDLIIKQIITAVWFKSKGFKKQHIE